MSTQMELLEKEQEKKNELQEMSDEARAVNEEILLEEYDMSQQSNAEIIADIMSKSDEFDSDMLMAGNSVTFENMVESMPFIFALKKDGKETVRNSPERISGKKSIAVFDETMTITMVLTRAYYKNPFKRVCIVCNHWKIQTSAEVTSYIVEHNLIFKLLLAGWIVTLR